MAERDPLWLQAGNYTATEDRIALAALMGGRHFVDLAPSTSPLVSAGGGHGVIGATDMTVTAGAGTSVDVSLGLAMVRGTQQSDQGVYITSNDATKNLAISAADATNPRKDLAVTRVKDNEFGIAGDTGPLEIVTGTPTGGLTAGNATGRPTPPENALVLAEVFVPAGAASSASYTITDLRTRAAALGGITPCASSAFYPNPATPGMRVYDIALKKIFAYDGTNWVQIDALGAWDTWTPTLTQGAAVAKTVNRASWTRHGRMIEGDFYLTTTAVGTANNKITASLPVAAAAGVPAGLPIGVGFWYTGATTYQVNLCMDSATTVAWYQNGAGSPLGAPASTDGTALAIGAVMCGSFRYEAAASA